ncbi:hypothetical protein [Pararhizobium gei]|uniref:hypothetical protein n=1 Tax=Pararhizobium gei TaxID=1395951 RepID=UPI0023DA9A67|nr:hypothetical protein [Rhizobium gei]
MTIPPDPLPDVPGVPPLGQPDPPIGEPEPDRLPDEDPVPNPDENPQPPQYVGPLDALRDLS